MSQILALQALETEHGSELGVARSYSYLSSFIHQYTHTHVTAEETS
ncbi:hypothetical protein ACIQOW_24730 [Kitasatospora sp. NPDC091335]